MFRGSLPFMALTAMIRGWSTPIFALENTSTKLLSLCDSAIPPVDTWNLAEASLERLNK